MTPEEQAAADAAAAAKAASDNLGWRAGLPAEIQAHTTLAKFTGGEKGENLIPMPKALAQGYINAEQLIGREKIPMPKTDEEWMNTYNRLGRPETAEEYALAVDETFDPAAQEVLKLDIEDIRPAFHAAGLTNKQSAEVFKFYSTRINQKIEEVKEHAEEAKKKAEVVLRAEYGQGYEGKMILANRAAEALGGQELIDLLGATEVGSHPAAIKAFIKMGERMSEELGLDKDSGQILKTKEGLQDEVQALMNDPAYLDATNPQHTTIVAKVQRLMGLIHGTAPVAISLT